MVCVMRDDVFRRMDRVLARYSAGVLLADICVAEEVSFSTVLQYLKYARNAGDLRAAGRRVVPSEQRRMFLDALVAANGCVVLMGDLRDLIWGDERRRPSGWRNVLRVCASRLRGEGHPVKYEDGGYRLVLGGLVR